jgi:hypothetical protein
MKTPPPGRHLAPSLLSADFAALGASIAAVESEAGLLHVDVMDGHFVPNLTIGPPVVAALRRTTSLPLDCHLMIEAPERLLAAGWGGGGGPGGGAPGAPPPPPPGGFKKKPGGRG